MIGFLGCKCTLPAHVQLFIHQYPQVLLCRAALNQFIPQSVLMLVIVLTQVQDITLGLVELGLVAYGPVLTGEKFLLISNPLCLFSLVLLPCINVKSLGLSS